MNRFLFGVTAIALGGCAAYGYGLRPGASSDADVRAAMGRPAVEFTTADGSRKLFYPKGPLGLETLVAHEAPDGTFRGVENVLDEAHFYPIREGMTRDEILRAIGPPGDTMRLPYDKLAWEYRYRDAWGYLAEFSVTFGPGGVVLSKFTRRLNDGRDRGDK